MPYQINIDDFFQINENCNVYAVDRESKFIMLNEAQVDVLKKITPFSKLEEFIGKRMDEVFTAETAEMLVNENNLVMSSGKAHQFMNYLYHESFQSIIFATVKTPLYNEHKEVIGIFGISHYLATYQAPDFLFESLSKREKDCLQLLIKGKTTADIAESLSLSKRTIEAYIENIKFKLGCHTKADLVDKIFSHGIYAISGDTRAKSLPFNPGVFFNDVILVKRDKDK